MSSLRQIAAVTLVSLLGIPKRLGACSVIVVGIAGVVAVLISVFAMARGFTDTATKTGRSDRAIVLSQGARTEATSGIPRAGIMTVLNADEIKRTADGKSIASPDYITFARLSDRRTGLDAFATVRGTGPQLLSLRPEIKIVEGRMFEPGLREMIVGRTLQRRLQGLEIDSPVALPQGEWKIVGVFESNRDTHESELLTDVEMLLSAFQRNTFSSVTVSLRDAGSFDAFKHALVTNPAIAVDVRRETDYLAEASRPTAKLLYFIAYFIGSIMALGAVFAAVNAMFSAINDRSKEIATLRAIGYDGTCVVVSVFIESLLFALLGAIVGAAVAWNFFNGASVSTVTSAGPSPLTYALQVTPSIVSLGIATACIIGFAAGLFPAIRISRASVVAGLSGT